MKRHENYIDVGTLYLRAMPVSKLNSSTALKYGAGSMNDRLSEAVSKMSTLLSHHIIPLFLDSPSGRPQRCGSGFLVSAGSTSYLVSAAHVFDPLKDGHEPFFYIGPKTKRKLSGSARITRVPYGQDRQNDHLDIGVLKLQGPGLPPYPDVEKYPLPIRALRPGALPREGKQYLLVGFPGSQTRLDPAKREVTTKLYSYRNISHPASKYPSIGVDPQSHVAIVFDRKRSVGADGNTRIFPDPAEMSGSPVWLLYDGNGSNDRTQTPVVAVAIEHRKDQHAIVATDIGLALAYINGAV